jgi:hypothetical protein
MRLFRQPLPKLFGDDTFTRRTIRFAWHLLSVAWFGFAAVLTLAYLDSVTTPALLEVIGITFAVTAATALLASRGRHLSWLVFGAISIICFAAGNYYLTD